jgi:hypothetical protein
MSTDDRTLLANLGKEAAQLAKAKASEAAKGTLQKKLTVAIADARVLVAAREQLLLKGLQAEKARRKSEAKAFASSVKALKGKFAATGSHFQDAQKAIHVARDNGRNADPVLARLGTAFGALQMRLIDFSPFDGGSDVDAS